MGALDRFLGRRDPERRTRLARAAAAVDRELAADLELAALFDQTHQAVVFENSEFLRHGPLLEAEVPAAFTALASVYALMADTEAAMERRGPAGSLRPEDRLAVEAWEGDARVAQRALRDAAASAPPSVWSALSTRLRRRSTGR